MEEQAEAADPLEAYMIRNAVEVAASRAKELQRRLEAAREEEGRYVKLLEFVKG